MRNYIKRGNSLLIEKIKYTGKLYKCPVCGATIEGYMESFWKTPKGSVYGDIKQPNRPDEDSDEDNDEFIWKEVAGCVRCLDFWDAKDLLDITPVKVHFD